MVTVTAPPADVGMALEEIDTPALLLDLDAFEYNLALMANEVADAGITLRPHGKAHKCAEIARRQIALGAVGVCCQKVSEAEAFVDAGVLNVLVSNEVVATPKLDRLAALAQRAVIAVCVDDPSVVPLLSAAAGRAGVVLDVLVEIDVGGLRCGQLPGEPAARLGELVAGTRHLRLRGLQAYQGRAQHIRPYDERRAAIDKAAAAARVTVEMLRARGLSGDVVGGAGTRTYVHTGHECAGARPGDRGRRAQGDRIRFRNALGGGSTRGVVQPSVGRAWGARRAGCDHGIRVGRQAQADTGPL